MEAGTDDYRDQIEAWKEKVWMEHGSKEAS